MGFSFNVSEKGKKQQGDGKLPILIGLTDALRKGDKEKITNKKSCTYEIIFFALQKGGGRVVFHIHHNQMCRERGQVQLWIINNSYPEKTKNKPPPPPPPPPQLTKEKAGRKNGRLKKFQPENCKFPPALKMRLFSSFSKLPRAGRGGRR